MDANRSVDSCEKPAARLVRPWQLPLLYGAILAVAFSFRLPYLGARSLDEDEILSVLMARWNWGTFWWMASHIEANMFLYFGTLRFWIHLGQSDSVIRGLSVVAGLVSVLAVYWLGNRVFGRKVGCFAALLLAVNGFHIQYSQDARSYTLLVFLVTVSSFFFLEGIREGTWKNWILYIVTSTLAIYTHIFAFFVLLAHWISLLFAPRERVSWKKLIPATAAIALLALPMELFILFRSSSQLDWVPKPTFQGVLSLVASLAGSPDQSAPSVVERLGQSAFLNHSTWALLVLYLIFLMIGLLTLLKGRFRSRGAETWYGAFFLTWLIVPILLTLAISVRKPMFINRYLIICLPPFILLAAYGCSRLRKVWLLVPLFCIIVGLTAPALLDYYKQPGQDWRGIAQYILSNEKPGDAALFYPPYYGLRMTHYLKRKPYLDRSSGIQSDAYPRRDSRNVEDEVMEFDASADSTPQLALLVPNDKDSYDVFLHRISSRYDRLWFIERENKSSIENTLAAEFLGNSSEKLFSGGFKVILYQKSLTQGDAHKSELHNLLPTGITVETFRRNP